MGRLHKIKGGKIIEGRKSMGKSLAVIANPIAYVIKDKVFGELQIKNSANAWWLDEIKVRDLIKACKLDATIEECLSYAGITQVQYDYFLKLHPDFSRVKTLCKELISVQARITIANTINNPEIAKWYLERKKKNEFGTSGPVTAVQVNVGSDVVADAKVKKVVTEFEKKLEDTFREEIKNNKV